MLKTLLDVKILIENENYGYFRYLIKTFLMRKYADYNKY